MVHADASSFAHGVSKDDAYEQVLLQAEGLFTDQRNWVCNDKVGAASNLANAASLLWHAYKSMPAPSNAVNWAGKFSFPLPNPRRRDFVVAESFYVRDPTSSSPSATATATATKPQLILGPFQGKVACQTIRFGRGVCGLAAASRETQLVSNVDDFPGHIACDGESKSEVVVPIVAEGPAGTDEVVAIIDIDCAALDGFDDCDRRNLERLAELLSRSCDWP
ncbi:hypothetical protein CDD83_6671 [Cordyceps sp. RAO-2017]|nr:hypothetical protein CDD83_6671 [Cordyceps sp. RAO-2017]